MADIGWWNLSQILRWIAYRDISHPLPVEASFAIGSAEDDPFVRMAMRREQNAKIDEQMVPWEEDFLNKAKSSSLPVFGALYRDAPVSQLDHAAFDTTGLRLHVDPEAGADCIMQRSYKVREPLVFYHIRCDAQAVMALWPKIAKKQSAANEWMAALLQSDPPVKYADAILRCRSHNFAGHHFTDREAKAAWKHAKFGTPRKQGRRKSAT